MSNANYEAGLKLRHAMFGQQVTDDQIKAAGGITRPIQDMVTEQCFGDVWSRPGLELKTRSLLTLAMLIALGRSAELKIHLKGALSNGATVVEVRELICQAVVYCGLPAAAEAAYVAEAIFSKLDIDTGEASS